MSTVLFVVPIKSGKTATYKDFIKECLGPKRKEYKDLLVRFGCNTMQMWIHSISGKDYAMFTHELSENAAELLQGWSKSTHPFDQWFNRQLRDCYDIIDLDKMPPQPVFVGEIL